MNFQELMQRMADLDQPTTQETTEELIQDSDVEECGMGPGPMSAPTGQQDSVNMSVNMSGSGQGGIRDLLDILGNLEKKDAGGDMPIMIKPMGMDMSMEKEELANSPDEVYGDVGDVTATVNDLHSKGIERPAVAGGGNPMAVESIITRLDSLYQEIKSR